MKRKTKEALDKSYSDFENLTNICCNGSSAHTLCGKSKHGGSRKGAGRPKLKKSEKKEETIVIRIPKRLKEEIIKLKTSKR